MLPRVCDLFHIPNLLFHSMLDLIFLGVAIGLEFAVPWKSDLNPNLLEKGTLDPSEALDNFLGLAAWPPTACGVGVEISLAFTVFAAQVCRIKIIGRLLPSLNSFAYKVKNHVAILFALGAIGGSALPAGLSKTITLNSENGTNIFSSILGGFLLLLGARCTDGCSSGEGISGITHHLVGSFITSVCIFGDSIVFGFSASLSKNE
ncbi:unnamed protein product [Rotaria sp. Silwood2]|nr:unnamed protein product [Rotaria sp. Silwood2]